MSLAMWTVYQHPLDYPNKFVARRWDIEPGVTKPSASVIITPDLQTLQDILQFEMGLVRQVRWPQDDPTIVEVWL